MRFLKVAASATLLCLAALGFTAATPQASPSDKSPSPPALRILWDRELPPALQQAVDVRWASDNSVYLALTKSGTVEVSLDPLGGNLKEMVPGANKPGGFWGSSRLGASSEYLAVAGPAFSLTWRTLASPLRKEIAFDGIEDIDVGGAKLAVLGARRDEKGNFAPEGAIAWLGSLDKDLKDLKPILLDQRGNGAPNLNACGNFEIGAIRFLPAKHLLVVPGFQAGANLYDAQGRLIRTWDTVALGLDNDCPSLGEEQVMQLRHPLPRIEWLNQRRTLDDIVPLSEDPGLLVRRVVQGLPTWELKVLGRNGPSKIYSVPVPPVSDLSRLRVDVRGNRIVFLLTTLDKTFLRSIRGRLILAELPA